MPALTPFDGDYSKWSAHDKAFETWFFGTEYKSKKIKPDGSGVGVSRVYLMAKLSFLPDPIVNFQNGWNMGQFMLDTKSTGQVP